MILLTGGTGYIGRNLLRQILCSRPSARVVLLSRSEGETRPAGRDRVHRVRGDIRDPDSTSNALEGVDIVVHLAAEIDPGRREDFDRTNVAGTRILVEEAGRAGVKKLIFMSSFDVNDPIPTRYSESKKEAESIIMNSGIDYVIIRPTAVYGGGGIGPFTSMIRLIDRFRIVPMVGAGHQMIQPLHVDDLSSLVCQSLSARYRNAIYEIGGPERVTHRELVRAIAWSLGKSCLAVPVPYTLLKFLLKPASRNDRVLTFLERIGSLRRDKIVDNSRVLRDFEIRFTRLSDGLTRAD